MQGSKLIILDVGHGNCAIIIDSEGIVLIDCPPGTELADTLKQLNITKISHVLISHADKDHIAGLPNLLLNKNVQVANIHLNPDSTRRTRIWNAVRRSLFNARKTSNVNIKSQLTTSTKINVGHLNIEVLAPAPELALSGVGGLNSTGKKIRSNSMSAVISVGYRNQRSVLLMGDLDQTGLEYFIKEDRNYRADVLVFPHHGGKPGLGVDSQIFAQNLCNIVQPNLVIFSIDRVLHRNPDNEIIRGVLSAVPQAHIMCTQLSEKCATSLPLEEPGHLTDLPSKGSMNRKCCAGTIVIEISEEGMLYTPSLGRHKDFVSQYPNSICQRYP